MNDVTLPADVAKRGAEILRAVRPETVSALTKADLDHLADLLDPRPVSLREQVADALNRTQSLAATADAVLAVVADWLAAQPLLPSGDRYGAARQRDADVALIRGGAE